MEQDARAQKCCRAARGAAAAVSNNSWLPQVKDIMQGMFHADFELAASWRPGRRWHRHLGLWGMHTLLHFATPWGEAGQHKLLRQSTQRWLVLGMPLLSKLRADLWGWGKVQHPLIVAPVPVWDPSMESTIFWNLWSTSKVVLVRKLTKISVYVKKPERHLINDQCIPRT